MEHELYEKLAALFPQFMNREYSYLRLESNGFEPLSLEWIFGDRISIMHTYELNGDLCCDPMVDFIVNSTDKTMTASSYEQSIPPIYNIVYSEPGKPDVKLQRSINDFASQWFDNIESQGFMPVKAIKEIDGEDVHITFDPDGNSILPEPEKPDKQYDINYGHLGNGLTVWNRLEEKDGDYVTIAHIGPDRVVTFYDKDLPDSIKAEIDHIALTSDARISVTQQDQCVFYTPPLITELDMSLPDPTQTITKMNEYGYTDPYMFSLSLERAVELFDTDHCIYLLYPDNTEAMVFGRDEILNHAGLCGIESGDWECSPIRAAQLAIADNSEAVRESELLHGATYDGMFGIYQIRDDIDEARNFSFASMKELEALGLTVDRANYKLVYTAPLTISDTQKNLNMIYTDFNDDNRPADFAGRSVSVSDVIVIQMRSNISSHFVDSVGFVELPSFLGDETPSAPDLVKSEVAINADKQLSMTDKTKTPPYEHRPPESKGKSTLMEKLERGKQKVAQQGQPRAPKNNNREV